MLKIGFRIPPPDDLKPGKYNTYVVSVKNSGKDVEVILDFVNEEYNGNCLFPVTKTSEEEGQHA